MIIQNAIKVKDVILNSVHRWDYLTHDGVFIDGGVDYRRSNVSFAKAEKTDLEDLFLDHNSTIKEIKEKLLWGTRGKNGDEPFCWVKLIECNTGHLQAILDTQHQMNPLHRYIVMLILEEKKSEESKIKFK